MKNKYILLIATLLVCSISVWGQTKKSTSANSTKAIAEKVQRLESYTQEQFVQLQNENKALKEQLQKMEGDIALYREDVRTEISRMNTNMALWFGVLTLVIGGITAILGVAFPIHLNNKNDERQKEKLDEITKKLNEASTDAKAAKEDAEAAKKTLTDVERLKEDITSIKQTIEESAKTVKQSADEAQASKLFAEALVESKKEPQKAIELYTEVIKYDNKRTGAYNNRAILYRKLNKIAEAIADYNKAIELNPYIAEVYRNRGNLYMGLAMIAEAIADYNKAIELNPNYANAYLGRAECYRKFAENNCDNSKVEEYHALAEADEKKYEELEKKYNG